MPEVIPIGADHAGFELKERLVEELRALGYEPLDLGTDRPEATDYPDYAHQVASRVEHHDAEPRRAALRHRTRMSYAANRHPGVRAAVAWTPEIARLAREHNDANVLILPARFVSEEEGVEILKAWLGTVRRRPAQPPGREDRTGARMTSRPQRLPPRRRPRRSPG